MGGKYSVRELLIVLADPRPGYWRTRMHAARTLARAHLEPELADRAVDVLSTVLDDEVPGDDRDEREAAYRRRLLLLIPLAALVCIGVGAVLSSIVGYANIKLWILLLIPLCLASGPLWRALLLDLEDYRVRQLQRAAARTLCRLRLPRSVGALALALRRYPHLRGEAETAFAAAVAELTPDHYGTLPRNAVQHLCRLLGRDRQHESVDLQCLEALGKAGNRWAIPSVIRMQAKGRTERIRQAAADILPILEQRRRLETDHHLLLRGTTAPAIPSTLLLRSSSGGDLPSQMLRPVGRQPDRDSELLLRTLPENA